MEDLKIRLVLEGAEQVQAGAGKAADGLGRLGQAGQRAGQQVQLSGQQMAQVSAQLQDLFVQIQGGQAPLTAILQQGSQLSAVFGGVGNAVRAVGAAIGPVGAVVGIAAASVAAAAVAYNQGAEEAQAFTRALVLSGSAAGVTVGQLQEMARAQSLVVGTQGEAAAALARLAATGQVSAGSLQSAAEAAVRFARVGGDIDAVAKSFAKLGGAPLKGLIELNEAENFLTVSVYKQVQALTEQGRTAEAAALAQQTYAAAVNGRAKQLEQSLGSVERLWVNVKDAAKAAWDTMLNVGRAETTAGLDRQIAILQRRQQVLGAGNAQQQTEAILIAQQVSALQSQRDVLADIEGVQRRHALAQEESARATKHVIAADEEAEKAVKKLAAAREHDAAALERAVGLSGTYQKDLQQLMKLRAEGVNGIRLSEEQYVAAVQKLITAQPVIREQLQAQAEAQREAAKALDDLQKAEQRRIDGLFKSADQVGANVLKLQTEEQALALSVKANTSLAEAIERVTIARLEEAHAKASAELDFGGAAALRAEIEQREKLASLIGRKETRDAAKRSAEDAAREWKRATGDMERSLTDALMRGFESGKGFAITLRDTIVNMFKTMVLRPVVQAIVQPVANSLTGWLQGGSGGGGIGSIAQLIGGAGSLTGSSWLSAFGSGMGLNGSQALAASRAYTQAGMSGTGSAISAGAGVAAFAPYAALIAMAMGAADGAYAKGFNQRTFSYTDAWLKTAMLTPFIAPPTMKMDTNALVGLGVNERLANVITGASLWSRAFGRSSPQLQGQGITGTINSGGFTGQAYADWLQKGGWFRSDKTGTDYSPISKQLDAELDRTISALYKSAGEYAKVLGLPVSAVNGYAAQFKVVWGKSEEENKAALEAAVANVGEQLASRYAAQLAPLQRYGETLAGTLSRLSTLQTFSNGLNSLGGVFSRLAATSVTAREHLIDLAGGMDALNQQALGFVQNYYNREEIAGLKAREVQGALGAAGVTTEVNSREQFRALVESLDPNSTTGREQLAALLALQGSFATVSDYLTESGLTLSQAAALAPANDMLSPLLSTVSQQLQLAQQSMDAQYETRDATLRVVDAVATLTSTIRELGGSSGGWMPGYRQPEVTQAY
jgi:hypothetical protein